MGTSYLWFYHDILQFPNSGKPHRIKIHVNLGIAHIAFGLTPHSNGQFLLKIFNSAGPKMCKGNVIWTRRASSNGRSSETKRDFLDQLVPKFLYGVDQGFHRLFHESDSAPLSHPLSASFLKETSLLGCSRAQNFSEIGHLAT